MMNRKLTMGFQRAMDGVHTLPLTPPKGTQKPIFQFLGIKFNFSRTKSATKFHCVKTCSSRIVEQSTMK